MSSQNDLCVKLMTMMLDDVDHDGDHNDDAVCVVAIVVVSFSITIINDAHKLSSHTQFSETSERLFLITFSQYSSSHASDHTLPCPSHNVPSHTMSNHFSHIFLTMALLTSFRVHGIDQASALLQLRAERRLRGSLWPHLPTPQSLHLDNSRIRGDSSPTLRNIPPIQKINRTLA